MSCEGRIDLTKFVNDAHVQLIAEVQLIICQRIENFIYKFKVL